MTQTQELERADAPQPAEDSTPPEEKAAAPDADGDVKIKVKFNKEQRELTESQAAHFAQLGMKYEQIRGDFERLRALAAREGAAVPAFLTRLEQERRENRRAQLLKDCGGIEELAAHILQLETADEPDSGFEELHAQFPQLDTPDKLPESVREAARTRGTQLLDEYLRYRLAQQKRRDAAARQRRSGDSASIGPQQQYAPGHDGANTAFLRGIWSR